MSYSRITAPNTRTRPADFYDRLRLRPDWEAGHQAIAEARKRDLPTVFKSWMRNSTANPLVALREWVRNAQGMPEEQAARQLAQDFVTENAHLFKRRK